jgi:hypothetical protein
MEETTPRTSRKNKDLKPLRVATIDALLSI